MNLGSTRILIKMHFLVLFMGFFLGALLLPDFARNGSELIAEYLPRAEKDDIKKHQKPFDIPTKNFAPNTAAILPKNVKKWK